MTTSTTEKIESNTPLPAPPHFIAATFAGPDHARQVVEQLIADHVDTRQLGFVMADSAEARQLLEDGPKNPVAAAVLGSAVGGTLSGVAAVVLAGPVGLIAAGPLVALLGGAAAGAGAGGLLGALIGLGVPQHEAALRSRAVQDGGILVTFPLGGDEEFNDRVQRAFEEHGARDVFRV